MGGEGLFWWLLVLVLAAVAFRALTDAFRRVVEGIIYTVGGVLLLLLLLRYYGDIHAAGVRVLEVLLG